MGWLLSRDDVRFFQSDPPVARSFRRDRYRIFLGYWRELHNELTQFDRESLRLVAHGAWDLLPHLCRNRAVLLYHQGRLLRAALAYRWLPSGRAGHAKSAEDVRNSLSAILSQIAQPAVS